MLSLSAEISDSNLDLKMINGDADAAAGIPHGRALLDFAEAVAHRDEEALARARETLAAEAGEGPLVDAAGVAANFQRMVRIADSTGIPLDTTASALSTGIRKELDLGSFASAQNTPADSWKVKLLSLIAWPMARRRMVKARS